MYLGTVLVTLDRLEYTKKTIQSYVRNTTVRHKLCVVDNGSQPETIKYLRTAQEKGYIDHLILNDDNRYPGAAANQGWEWLAKDWDIDALHRSDNDVYYNEGWAEYVEDCFIVFQQLGQLGLLPESALERNLVAKNGVRVFWHSIDNVGGVNVIAREVWDSGIRWEEVKWAPGQLGEDWYLSTAIRDAGYDIAVVEPDICELLSYDQYLKYPEYDQRTAAERGVVANWRG